MPEISEGVIVEYLWAWGVAIMSNSHALLVCALIFAAISLVLAALAITSFMVSM